MASGSAHGARSVPTAEELAARYVERLEWRVQRRPGASPPGGSLTTWEHWIERDPERAWPVFVEIVRLRPESVDVLEQLWRRLQMLLRAHSRAFHARALALVAANPLLSRIAPPAQLDPAFYRPRRLDIPALVRAYLTLHAHHEAAHAVGELVRADPDAAWPVVLEIVRRAPRYGFTSWDVLSPLRDLLRAHGDAVIERLEAAAAESVMLRRCLWRIGRLQSHPPDDWDVPAGVWARAERAAAGTTDYNTDDPAGEAHPLPPGLERLVEPWFVYEEHFWAWDRVNDLVREDPNVAWRVITLLVDEGPDDALGLIAAGPLEDLLAMHGEPFIDAVEARAARDPRFRRCLAGVWRTEIADAVWRRVRAAVGEDGDFGELGELGEDGATDTETE